MVFFSMAEEVLLKDIVDFEWQGLGLPTNGADCF